MKMGHRLDAEEGYLPLEVMAHSVPEASGTINPAIKY